MPDNTNGNAGGADNSNTGSPSFQEILEFDPFEGGATPAAEPPSQSAEGGDQTAASPASSGDDNGRGQQASGDSLSPAPAAPTPQPPTPVSQADLESLMRQQTNTIAAALNRQPQQQQTPSAPPNKFNLAVPDQLMGALRSEDPAEFKAGVGALINSLANHVWEHFRQAVQGELLPMIPRMIEQHTSSAREQESVGRDFYGTYPQLQNPMFAPMIQTVGATIAEEYARAGRSIAWGPELRDEIAKRIFSVLPSLREQQQQQAPQNRRTFSTGNGSRPPAPTDRPQEEMLQMLFGGPQH
jgi:hypothetical protein